MTSPPFPLPVARSVALASVVVTVASVIVTVAAVIATVASVVVSLSPVMAAISISSVVSATVTTFMVARAISSVVFVMASPVSRSSSFLFPFPASLLFHELSFHLNLDLCLFPFQPLLQPTSRISSDNNLALSAKMAVRPYLHLHLLFHCLLLWIKRSPFHVVARYMSPIRSLNLAIEFQLTYIFRERQQTVPFLSASRVLSVKPRS